MFLGEVVHLVLEGTERMLVVPLLVLATVWSHADTNTKATDRIHL